MREPSGARVTPGCWPKLPPIMIIRRRLTCYNSLWDEFPLNAHLLTIHLAAADLYIHWGRAYWNGVGCSGGGVTFVMAPQAAGRNWFRASRPIYDRAQFSNCVLRRRLEFKRNAAELILATKLRIEIAVFGFSAIERGFLKKDACFFHHSSARAHKRLCHLRIDNGNENSPAWIIHRAGIIERG